MGHLRTCRSDGGAGFRDHGGHCSHWFMTPLVTVDADEASSESGRLSPDRHEVSSCFGRKTPSSCKPAAECQLVHSPWSGNRPRTELHVSHVGACPAPGGFTPARTPRGQFASAEVLLVQWLPPSSSRRLAAECT